jgi:hypothetical protein
MAEDIIDRYHCKKAERLAAEAAEAERLSQVATAKAAMPYSQQLAQAICDLVAEGEVLKDICLRETMPPLKVVRRWLIERPEFAQALREAERDRVFAWEDELLIRARDMNRDRVAKEGGFAPDPTAVARSKLQCDTLARLLRAHYPTVWGNTVRRVRNCP